MAGILPRQEIVICVGSLRQLVRRKLLREVEEKVIQFVNKIAPRQLPFEDMFQGKLRLTLPLPPNKETKKIIKRLERRQWTVDLDNKTATKDGKNFVRLGKVIRRELGQDALDDFAMIGDAMTVVVSRAPVDVLRMSDFQNIQSCHSQGGSFFRCAIEEAQDGGAVAYVVKTKDIKDIDLQADEIFADRDREVSGVKPISRMRLRRFIDLDTMEDFAIPDLKVYGQSSEDLPNILRKWAKTAQPGLTGQRKERELAQIGTSYWDHYPSDLIDAMRIKARVPEGKDEAHKVIAQKAEEIRSERLAKMVDQWKPKVIPMVQEVAKKHDLKIGKNDIELTWDEVSGYYIHVLIRNIKMLDKYDYRQFDHQIHGEVSANYKGRMIRGIEWYMLTMTTDTYQVSMNEASMERSIKKTVGYLDQAFAEAVEHYPTYLEDRAEDIKRAKEDARQAKRERDEAARKREEAYRGTGNLLRSLVARMQEQDKFEDYARRQSYNPEYTLWDDIYGEALSWRTSDLKDAKKGALEVINFSPLIDALRVFKRRRISYSRFMGERYDRYVASMEKTVEILKQFQARGIEIEM